MGCGRERETMDDLNDLGAINPQSMAMVRSPLARAAVLQKSQLARAIGNSRAPVPTGSGLKMLGLGTFVFTNAGAVLVGALAAQILKRNFQGVLRRIVLVRRDQVDLAGGVLCSSGIMATVTNITVGVDTLMLGNEPIPVEAFAMDSQAVAIPAIELRLLDTITINLAIDVLPVAALAERVVINGVAYLE